MNKGTIEESKARMERKSFLLNLLEPLDSRVLGLLQAFFSFTSRTISFSIKLLGKVFLSIALEKFLTIVGRLDQSLEEFRTLDWQICTHIILLIRIKMMRNTL